MTFDRLAEQASGLTVEQQSELLFRLIGNLNAYYKYQLDQPKALTKEQALSLITDALSEVEK